MHASAMTGLAVAPRNTSVTTKRPSEAPSSAARADTVRAGMARRLEEIHAKEQLYSQVHRGRFAPTSLAQDAHALNLALTHLHSQEIKTAVERQREQDLVEARKREELLWQFEEADREVKSHCPPQAA
jgi:hypothetical protein